MNTSTLIAQQTATINIRDQLSQTAGVQFDLGAIISTTIPVVIVFAAIAVLIYLVIAGYNWLTSGGEKGKVEEARSRITNAIIGLAIIASAFAVYSIIDKFFGIGLINSRHGGGSQNNPPPRQQTP